MEKPPSISFCHYIWREFMAVIFFFFFFFFFISEIGKQLWCDQAKWIWSRKIWFLFFLHFRSYSDCLRWEINFLASTRRVTALCVPVCCTVCVCDCVMVIRKPTRKYICTICTRTRQWPDALKPKSYSLVEGNQTIGYCLGFNWVKTPQRLGNWFQRYKQLKDWTNKRNYRLWLNLKNSICKFRLILLDHISFFLCVLPVLLNS